MELTATKADWDANKEGTWLKLLIPHKQAMQAVAQFHDGKSYTVTLREERKRRSLDSNAYAWLLMGKLAAKVGVSKEDIYRNMIRDVGDNYVIVPIEERAVDRWIENWQSKGTGWVCEVLGPSKLKGYVNVITYYGSSTYDTAQMSTLINLIVLECKAQGIETMREEELSLLLEGWSA